MAPTWLISLICYIILTSCDVTEQKSIITDLSPESKEAIQDEPTPDVIEDITQKMGVGKTVFKAVDLPKHFASYDVFKRDGKVSFDELVNVTGVEKNAKGVFEASDIDGDGVLSPGEFSDAPWFLGDIEEVDEETIELPVVLEEIEEDLTSMDNSKKDLYSKPIKETVQEFIEQEKQEEINVKNEIKRRKYHVFSKHDTDIW